MTSEPPRVVAVASDDAHRFTKPLQDDPIRGRTVRLAGVMSIVTCTGVVRPGDEIRVVLPTGAPQPLEAV